MAAKTGGCFPGDAQVFLEGGGTKQMRHLLPGDRVLSSSTKDGHTSLLYSPVISFLDRQPNIMKTFYIIGTDAGFNISLTAAHLIFTADCADGGNKTKPQETFFPSIWTDRGRSGAHLRTVFASQVQPGQCVYTSSEESEPHVRISVVTFVEEQRSTGLYAPLTQHGSIVVNGVLSSCYAAVDSHELSHWAFAPLRFLYSMLGSSQAQSDGVHWYPRLLHRLGELLLDAGHFHPWGIEQ